VLIPGAATAALGSTPQPCPTSPNGWKADAANPTIFGPAQQPGQHQTMITCNYTKGPVFTASVVAEYANPDDPNPNADFFFGCKANRHQDWNLIHRTYFISNPDNWSYVEFTDPSHQLPNASVPTFERVAQNLLENVAPLAHNCRLNTTTPTVMQHSYLFGFEFFLSSGDFKAFGGVPARSQTNVLIPAGSFTSTSEGDATSVAKIVKASAPPFTVNVIDNGKSYDLRMRITGGGNFAQQPPLQRLNLNLRVVSSSYARCPTGSRGTVSIIRSQYLNAPNSPATVRVRLCGSVFRHGTYRGTALLIAG
jgi:hypothetical protein